MARDEQFVDLVALAHALASKWLNILICAITLGALSLAGTYVLSPRYSSSVTMLPQTSKNQGDLLGKVAAITGTNISAEQNFEELYSKILVSDRLLDTLLAARWTWKGHKGTSMFAILGLLEEPLSRQPAVAKQILRNEIVTFTRDKKTGFMVLKATVVGDPVLAADLVNFLTSQLDEYNRLIRRTKASSNRKFVEDELQRSSVILAAAEDSLAVFLEKNRSFERSPSLARVHRHYVREVEAATVVWTELRRQLALAIIDENRDNDSINILDRATPQSKPVFPNRRLLSLLGFLVGAALATLAIALRFLLVSHTND